MPSSKAVDDVTVYCLPFLSITLLSVLPYLNRLISSLLCFDFNRASMDIVGSMSRGKSAIYMYLFLTLYYPLCLLSLFSISGLPDNVHLVSTSSIFSLPPL